MCVLGGATVMSLRTKSVDVIEKSGAVMEVCGAVSVNVIELN